MNGENRYIWRADSEAGTVELASRLAGLAWPGMTLALDGELGAGKTRFAQAFDYFFGDGVTLVEWASRIGPILPPERLHLHFEAAGPVSRKITAIPVGERYDRLCRDAGMAPAREGSGE